MSSTALKKDFSNVETIPVKLLGNGEPIPFPIPDPHYAFVGSLRRNSGLTSCRWFDANTLFAGDFAARRVYRVRPFDDEPIADWIPTLNGKGKPTETDLMDIKGNTMVMTNFYTGEVAFYEVSAEQLKFSHTILPPTKLRNERGPVRSFLRQLKGKPLVGRRIHGAIFVPGFEDLLWVSYCDARDKGFEIIKAGGEPVHSMTLPEQGQDVSFLEQDGITYAIQAARTDHITIKEPNEKTMYVTLFVYRLPKDLYSTEPELILTRHFPGHLDATKAYKGAIYAANQHDSCIDEFIYNAQENELTLARRFTGFDMPHGLDVSPEGVVAVTNYGPENDLRIFKLDR